MLKIKRTILKRIMSCALIFTMILTLMPVFELHAEDSNSRLYTYDGYTIDYTVKSNWENNQSISVKITNTGTEPILDWAVKYDSGGMISEVSNAAIYKQTDNVYILKNVGYNYEIRPNQSVSFSYAVKGENLTIPDNINFVSKKIKKISGFDVQYSTDDWGKGFQTNVTITNSTDNPIEAWALTFDGNFTIANIWNAIVAESNQNSYTVSGPAWTGPIPANSSVSFSFTGSKEAGATVELSNLSLTETVISDEPDEPERPDDGIIDQGDIEELLSHGKIEVIRGDDGTFRVIDGTFTNRRVNSASDAADILNSAASLFGYGFSASASQITVQSIEGDDKAGEENIYRYSPTVKGIPVLGSQIVLIANGNGVVQSLFNTYNNSLGSVNTRSTVTAQEATNTAIAELLSDENIADFLQRAAKESGYDYDTVKNAFLSVLTTDANLIVYAASNKEIPALAWEVKLNTYADSVNGEVYNTNGISQQIAENASENNENPAATESRPPVLPYISETIYIYANGASAGSVLADISNIDGWSPVTLQASDLLNNNRFFSAEEENGLYQMRDNGRNIETYTTDYDNFLSSLGKAPGNLIQFTDVPSKSAVSAHANVAAAYDFYKNILNRASYDGRGGKVISSIDYDKNSWFGGKYQNASWDRKKQQFLFGNAGNFEGALDVVGHEYTHAVINHVVGDGKEGSLLYENESGALNESYADIMGSLIENKSGDNRWIMGEDCDAEKRNMANPTDYFQPDHYDNLYEGEVDLGGVHINSGIFNFAAYKMMTDNRTVTVSRETWAKVFYRSLFRLTPSSEFLDARGAIINSAKGVGFSQTQLQAVKDAFDQVGIKESDNIRIVLRWGMLPYDLDSHLIGPAGVVVGNFHVYYSQRSYFQNGTYSAEKGQYVADLDYDDTSSYGPEITTIHDLTPGDYYFYVHDYSNKDKKSSTELAKSGAIVSVYFGSGSVPMQTFDINQNSNGNLWSVFKLTISPQENITITPMDEFSYCSKPALIGS